MPVVKTYAFTQLDKLAQGRAIAGLACWYVRHMLHMDMKGLGYEGVPEGIRAILPHAEQHRRIDGVPLFVSIATYCSDLLADELKRCKNIRKDGTFIGATF